MAPAPGGVVLVCDVTREVPRTAVPASVNRPSGRRGGVRGFRLRLGPGGSGWIRSRHSLPRPLTGRPGFLARAGAPCLRRDLGRERGAGSGPGPRPGGDRRLVGQNRSVPSLGLVAQCEHRGHMLVQKTPCGPAAVGGKPPLPAVPLGRDQRGAPCGRSWCPSCWTSHLSRSPSCSGQPGLEPCSARGLSVSSLCPRCSPCRGAVGLRWTGGGSGSGVSGRCLAGGPRAENATYLPAARRR